LAAPDLCWRVERLCHLAWPSLKEEIHGDWVFRFSGNLSRRGNSANPQRATGGDIGGMLAAAEAAFPREGLATLVRIPTLLSPEIERQVAARGYSPEGETLTLLCPLPAQPGATMPMRRDPDVAIAARPDAAWLARIAEMKSLSDKDRATYRAIVAALEIPAVFMALRHDQEIVAMGFVALHDKLCVIESLVTDSAHRGRGHGRRLLGAMLAWAIGEGAEGACLQVAADNAPAIRLYRGMGFLSELYRYRYWRAR
jgi:ribosomal protein S18 acetylase RimI-like enzyme